MRTAETGFKGSHDGNSYHPWPKMSPLYPGSDHQGAFVRRAPDDAKVSRPVRQGVGLGNGPAYLPRHIFDQQILWKSQRN